MARLPDNVEKSAFLPNTYVAYDPRGYVWHVRKARTFNGEKWRAQPAANNPARSVGSCIEADTLTAVATTIANRRPARVVVPF